jgi:hypothetical protein
MRAPRSERGQATVEWLGLLLLAGLLLGAVVHAVGLRPPGIGLVDAVAERLACAVRLSRSCASAPRLEAAYGHDLRAALQAHAPVLLYEDGMKALPVDFRRCREDRCAHGSGDGFVASSDAGRRVVAFTHAIDCRAARRAGAEAAGADCSGERAGRLYLQYWFYYPGSATAEGSTFLKRPIRKISAAAGVPTYHRDDWESYQVRIGPDGRFARASSHHGYSYELGGGSLIPGHELRARPNGTVVIRRRPRVINGWGPEVGTLYVSGGSHAGNARAERVVSRTTKDHRLVLIPLRRISLRSATDFAVTPPWAKRVYRDPEYAGTD